MKNYNQNGGLEQVDLKPDTVVKSIRNDFFDNFPLNLLLDDLTTPLKFAIELKITTKILLKI